MKDFVKDAFGMSNEQMHKSVTTVADRLIEKGMAGKVHPDSVVGKMIAQSKEKKEND